jgi:transcription elongation factor-like protein
MTAAGYSALHDELRHRIQCERAHLVERIQQAIADDSNLAENSEYHTAQTEQQTNEARIAELEEKLARAEIIDRKSILESGGKADDCAPAPHHAKQRKPVSSSSATQFGAADAGIPHPEGGRETDQGGEGWPLGSPGRDAGAGRLPAWPADFGNLRFGVVAGRVRPLSVLACPPGWE